MKYFLQTGIFMVLVIVFGTCKKNNKDQPITNPQRILTEPSEELKMYALFKPGSYWIYRNLSDNSLDSLYIQMIDTVLLRESRNYLIKFGLEDSLPKYFELYGHFFLFNNKVSESVDIGGWPKFMIDTTVLVNPGNYGISENKSLALVNIQNQNYDSCRYVKSTYRNYFAATKTFFDHSCELIWKKHIGILKYHQNGYPGLDSWELVRYDVKQ